MSIIRHPIAAASHNSSSDDADYHYQNSNDNANSSTGSAQRFAGLMAQFLFIQGSGRKAPDGNRVNQEALTMRSLIESFLACPLRMFPTHASANQDEYAEISYAAFDRHSSSNPTIGALIWRTITSKLLIRPSVRASRSPNESKNTIASDQVDGETMASDEAFEQLINADHSTNPNNLLRWYIFRVLHEKVPLKCGRSGELTGAQTEALTDYMLGWPANHYQMEGPIKSRASNCANLKKTAVRVNINAKCRLSCVPESDQRLQRSSENNKVAMLHLRYLLALKDKERLLKKVDGLNQRIAEDENIIPRLPDTTTGKQIREQYIRRTKKRNSLCTLIEEANRLISDLSWKVNSSSLEPLERDELNEEEEHEKENNDVVASSSLSDRSKRKQLAPSFEMVTRSKGRSLDKSASAGGRRAVSNSNSNSKKRKRVDDS